MRSGGSAGSAGTIAAAIECVGMLFWGRCLPHKTHSTCSRHSCACSCHTALGRQIVSFPSADGGGRTSLGAQSVRAGNGSAGGGRPLGNGPLLPVRPATTVRLYENLQPLSTTSSSYCSGDGGGWLEHVRRLQRRISLWFDRLVGNVSKFVSQTQ